MKSLVKVVLILLVFIGIFHYRDKITSFIKPQLETVAIKAQNTIQKVSEQKVKTKCDEPIKYSLGQFDDKFDISQEYFLQALKDAESIWENSIHKNLFLYDQANGDLKVNLIFDYRQETKNNLAKIGIVVQENRDSYDKVKAQYTAAKTEYTRYKISYDSQVLAYNTRNTTYKSQVVYWNNRGGAPQEEYDKLMQERAYLDSEVIRLQNMFNTLTNLVNKVNVLASILNNLVEVLNLNVKEYNTVGAKLGESYEEGLYTSDGTNRKIDIFEFDTYEQLVRVLAHEMGHAIGIGHLEDPNSMMYEKNSSKSLSLTQPDIAALNVQCGLQIAK